MKRWLAPVLGIGLPAAVLVAIWVVGQPTPPAPQATPPDVSASTLRSIVAGGGPVPESNEVSIEDDLALASRVLPQPSRTLFASGPDNRSVRVESAELSSDPLVAQLGTLFNPRPGRGSRYQAARIKADGPASPTELLSTVEAASAAGSAPLTIYIAGHGSRGETPRDNTVSMWANLAITPVDLATATALAQRTTRVVVTTCFSGGFAELAFREADPSLGAHPGPVCGLFAATADQEAGGCDPNPDRGAHDGYGVHFLSALEGKNRHSAHIAADALDIDGDGKVTLLDAHTFARLKSKSIDVPTTTSERWLREHAKLDGGQALPLSHEQAVIDGLKARLEDVSQPSVERQLAQIQTEIEAATEAERRASEAETDAYYDAAAAILARWPVLDDPWHPLWRETLEDNRSEIARFLAESPAIKKLSESMAATNIASERRSELEIERAPLQRVHRAYETQALAGALNRTGGPNWEQFLALRACENSPP